MSKIVAFGFRGLAAMMGPPPPEGQSSWKKKKKKLNVVKWSLSKLCTSEVKLTRLSGRRGRKGC